jgi:hypothetical protein
MTKGERRDLILRIIGIVCPCLFCLAAIGLQTGLVGVLPPFFTYVGWISILATGPIGFVSVLALLIRSRKGFKRNVSAAWDFLFFLVLLIINFCVTLAVCLYLMLLLSLALLFFPAR